MKEHGHIVIFALIIFIVCFGSMTFDRLTVDNVEFTVTKTDISITGGKTSSSKMLVFSKKETFQCEDSWAFGVFNSSDTFGMLEKGKTYKAKVCGWRFSFFSMYRNIIKVEEVQAFRIETAGPARIIYPNP